MRGAPEELETIVFSMCVGGELVIEDDWKKRVSYSPCVGGRAESEWRLVYIEEVFSMCMGRAVISGFKILD